MLKTDDLSYDYWRKSIRNEAIGFGFYSVGLGFAILSVTPFNTINARRPYSIGSVGMLGAGVGFLVSSATLKRRAILRYNEQVTMSSIRFGPTPNGIGLAVNF